MIQMIASDVGLGVASALAEMAEDAGVDPLAPDVAERAALWTTISAGGWDLIGTPGAVDGEQLPLRELLEVALAWGRHYAPVPLIPTICAKRWSAAAREHPGPVSFGVPSGKDGGTGRVPHGDFPGLRVLSAGREDGDLLEPGSGPADDFAPTLHVVAGPLTDFPEVAVREVMVLFAGEALGAARRMHERAVAYAQERRQFGQPIGQFQAVKHQLADAHTALEVAESALAWAAQGTDDGRRHVGLALDHARSAATTAIHVHGGMGFTWELGLHVPLRQILATRDLLGGWLDRPVS